MADVMPERTRRLFLLFKAAVKREQLAQERYKEAAELCDDPELKKILEAFHQDEVRHERVLLERYEMLREQYNLPE